MSEPKLSEIRERNNTADDLGCTMATIEQVDVAKLLKAYLHGKLDRAQLLAWFDEARELVAEMLGKTWPGFETSEYEDSTCEKARQFLAKMEGN